MGYSIRKVSGTSSNSEKIKGGQLQPDVCTSSLSIPMRKEDATRLAAGRNVLILALGRRQPTTAWNTSETCDIGVTRVRFGKVRDLGRSTDSS